MADAEERTEAPTGKRRDEARKKGQVARSQEIGSAVIVFFGFLMLALFGKSMYLSIVAYAKWILSPEMFVQFVPNQQNIGYFYLSMFYTVARIMAPVLLVLVVVGVYFNILQVGLKVSASPLTPNLNKLNPLSGLKRIFSIRSIQELVKNILKISLIGYVGFSHVRGVMHQMIKLHDVPLRSGFAFLALSIFKLVMKLSIIMIILAILDWIYQKYDFEKGLKMTKQEVKDEMKQREGDPLVRSRIRQKQREIAFQRMMAEVPKADVVITNPVHIAVALSYVAEDMHAPKVVAKGAGVIADRIKEVAKENEVPIIEDRPLAQQLFKLADVGDYVPPNLFKAVAEILAYVYRLGRKQHQFGI